MYTDHTKAIRGLSIAVLIISIIAIAGCIAGIICTAILWPAADNYLSTGGYNTPYAFQDDYGHTYSIDSHGVLAIGLGAVIGFIIWGLIVSVVTLVVGILGMRNAGKPETYRPVFIWSVIGAIISFFCGDIILLVLLIILAVFLNQDRKAAMNPNPYYTQAIGGAPYDPNYGYQNPPTQNPQGYGYAYPPQQNAQPGYGYPPQQQPAQQQPQQPTQQQPQPQQPTQQQPQQPTQQQPQPQQPVQPQQPATPESGAPQAQPITTPDQPADSNDPRAQ